MSNTPETPIQILQNGQARFVLAIEEILKSRGLEVVHSVRNLIIEISELKRERDEALEKYFVMRDLSNNATELAEKYKRERDEAREKLEDWENAAAHVEADHPDEVHCGCVPVLRKLLTDARQERDEAREALKHIEEYGTEEINAAVDLRQKLAIALLEHDKVQDELAALKRTAHWLFSRLSIYLDGEQFIGTAQRLERVGEENPWLKESYIP